MDYRKLGRSDLEVPVIGFGAWQAGRKGWGTEFDDGDTIEAMKFAFSNGVNYIDTAEMYGQGHSEEVIGKALSGFDREDIVIATKVNPPHFNHDDIIRSCEASIRRMNCGYIDLYQLHWPDHTVPVCETISAMEELIDRGMVRYIGVSNYGVRELQEAMSCTKRNEIVSNQMRYNLIQRDVESELFPFMRENGISMIAWSPIAKGLLSGKYSVQNIPADEARMGDPLFRKENVKKFGPMLDLLRSIAEKRGKTMVQVALNFLLRREAFAIPGIKRADQIRDCMGATGWSLSEEEIRQLLDSSPRSDLPGDE